MKIAIDQIRNTYSYQTAPHFKAKMPTKSIRDLNIGEIADNFIGKVNVLRNGQPVVLEAKKDISVCNIERYMLGEKFGRTAGEITIVIKNKGLYDPNPYSEMAKHVYVEQLLNNSNPSCFYREAEGLQPNEYSDIGTRLMQIAQKRSEEAGCGGNIQVNASRTSKEFYKKLGFVEVPSEHSDVSRLYLPPENADILRNYHGGL